MSTTRRSLLQGASLGAGSLLLSPFLQKLQAASQDVTKPPLRFVFVIQSNGFHNWAAQPTEIPITEEGPDKLVDLPLADYKLPIDLQPLERYIHDTTIIQRLNGEHTRPFHSGKFAALSGSVRAFKNPVAETVDAALSRVLPATYPLVNLGVQMHGSTPEDGLMQVLSAWGPDKPIGTQVNPNLAYKALFGEAGKDIDQGGVIMDGIRDDVRKVEQYLTAEQREEFAKYLDAFESLDNRSELFQRAEKLEVETPAADDRFRSEVSAQQLEAQFELAGAALATGLTNVATIASGACQYSGKFTGLGFDDAEMHRVGHFSPEIAENPEPNGPKDWKQIYTEMRQFHFRLITKLVDKLRAVSDPDGRSVMDRTIVIYTSDAADTHHSRGFAWPFVIVAGSETNLRTGRFLEYPAWEHPGNRTINALYCTLLHAAGRPREHFNLTGDIATVDKLGPLEDLLM